MSGPCDELILTFHLITLRYLLTLQGSDMRWFCICRLRKHVLLVGRASAWASYRRLFAPSLTLTLERLMRLEVVLLEGLTEIFDLEWTLVCGRCNDTVCRWLF